MEMKLDKEATEAVLLLWAHEHIGVHFNSARIEYYGETVFSFAPMTEPIAELPPVDPPPTKDLIPF